MWWSSGKHGAPVRLHMCPGQGVRNSCAHMLCHAQGADYGDDDAVNRALDFEDIVDVTDDVMGQPFEDAQERELDLRESDDAPLCNEDEVPVGALPRIAGKKLSPLAESSDEGETGVSKITQQVADIRILAALAGVLLEGL